MLRETINYEADGLNMAGQLRIADGNGRRPGILVFPEAFGLGEHAIGRAEQLAELGYVVLAGDLYGEARQLSDLPQVMAAVGELRGDPGRIRARANGALAALKARPEVDPGRIASIGYCFGGTMSLELAREGADIAAAIGFHSGLGTAAPSAANGIRARILACIGADDPAVSAAERAAFEEEMRAAGADWQLHIYGGVVHSFTNPAADAMASDFARYDAKADARSWASMIALFDEVFA